MPEIISRRDAAERGLKRFYTGQPCVHGHDTERYVSTSGCIGCLLINSPSRNGQRAVARGIQHWPPKAFTFLDGGKLVSKDEAEATFRYMDDQQWHMHALAQLRGNPALMARYARPPLTQEALREGIKAANALPVAELEHLLKQRTKT